MVFTVSQNGIDFLSAQEGGFLLQAYRLKGEAYYTIGLGHYCYYNQVVIDGVNINVKANTTITRAQALSLFKADTERFNDYVVAYAISKFPNLNQNQFDALFSYTFNRGPGGLQELINNSSTTIEIGDNLPVYWGGALEYKDALIARRYREQALFKTPVEGSTVQSSLYIGKYLVTPQIYDAKGNKWQPCIANIYDGGKWVQGTRDMWTRKSRPDDNNPYYNLTKSQVIWCTTNPKFTAAEKEDAKKALNYGVFGKVHNGITGYPVVLGLNALRNCVGCAWGAYNETWVANTSIDNGPPSGWYARSVDAHLTLDECEKDVTLKEFVVRLDNIPNPNDYIPPLGGIIVWSKQHVAYISEIIDKDTIIIQQSSYGGLSGGEGNPGAPWYNSDNGAWASSRITRGSGNTWWFNSGIPTGKCLGFLKNPAFIYDINGNCLGKKSN